MTTAFLFATASAAVAAGQAAQAVGAELNLEVSAKCVGRDAQFQVVNRGERWPALGTIRIDRVADHSVITQRKMRLVKDQKLSFKIGSKINPGDSVSLFVEPSWYSRPMKYDAEIICR